MSSKQREALSDACYAMFNFLKTQYGSCYEEMAKALDKAKTALAAPARNCDVMSLESAWELWFAKEILPRLDGDLPLGKEVPFEEWFVSQHEKGKSK